LPAWKAATRPADVCPNVLFRTNEAAFVQTKRRLLDSCNLWAVVSLPAGAFVNAGAGVKTDLLFFTRGERTESVWYYDLSDVKVGKKSPLTLDRFQNFLELLPARADSDRSWTVTRAAIEAKNYDLKAVNPHRKIEIDTRSPAEIMTAIEQRQAEVSDALKRLRELIGK
jgi:type I restriction enzyme M protein